MGIKPGLHLGDRTQIELSESRVLRRWFECEGQEVTGEWIECVMRFMICTPRNILFPGTTNEIGLRSFQF
jgi:hypothetical protein